LLRAVKTVLLVALPAGVGLAALREPVVRLLFARGAFDESDVAMTVFALLCFSFGLAGLSARDELYPRETVVPVQVGMASVIVALLLYMVPLFCYNTIKRWYHGYPGSFEK
jgi:putative peptidoglycan lipid II flippase